MKEEKWYLDGTQMEFLQRVVHRIDLGWDSYSHTTRTAITHIMDRGSYTPIQRELLLMIRSNWINEFCI